MLQAKACSVPNINKSVLLFLKLDKLPDKTTAEKKKNFKKSGILCKEKRRKMQDELKGDRGSSLGLESEWSVSPEPARASPGWTAAEPVSINKQSARAGVEKKRQL